MSDDLTKLHIDTYDISMEILQERERQFKKWGLQDHDEDRWMVILMEEVGEVARAIFDENADNYREELIQVAAVAVAAVEAFDRKFGNAD